jgi:IclR family transcriptional regulator, acetate operon repressor
LARKAETARNAQTLSIARADAEETVRAVDWVQNDGEPKSSAALRSLMILQAVAQATAPLTARDLVPKLNLPHPTVHRLAVHLEELGYLQREPGSKRFIGGHELQRLALDALINSAARGERHAILQELAERVEETCNVTVLDGNEVVYIDRVESHWPLRTHLQVGSRVPLHCGASGKVFLSFMPANKRKRLLTAAPLRRCTERTVVDPKRILIELKKVRVTKVGLDNQEFMPGLIGIAVPIFDSRGRACATVSMHAPTVRWTLEKVIAIAPLLTAAATRIARTLDPVRQEPAGRPAAPPKRRLSAANIAVRARRGD